jgi:HlyD family secretion protein
MLNFHSRMRINSAAAVGILFLASACSRTEPPEAESPVTVQSAKVQRSSIQRFIKARAVLYPFDQAGVVPKISSPILAFYVNRGDHVRKGQLLAVLENGDLTAAAAETRALYEQAQSNLRSTMAVSLPEETARAQVEVQATKEAVDAARKLCESRKELFEKGALARRQVDEANVAYAQARSQYEVALKHLDALEKAGREEQTKAAQAQLEAAKGRNQAAEAQLEYSRIRSPIDGVIADRPLYAGELASVGSPLLTVMDVSRVIARANVAVDELSFVKAGDPATIISENPPSELHGRVTVVSPALDPNSTTAEVWVMARSPQELLRPGLSVQVSIEAETIPDAVVIPREAILPSQDGSVTVLVVGPDSRAHERRIVAGIQEADKLQVLKGLEPGDDVVVVGGLGLQDNAKVRIEKSNNHE